MEESDTSVIDKRLNKRRQRRYKQNETGQKENEQVKTGSKQRQAEETSQKENEMNAKPLAITSFDKNVKKGTVTNTELSTEKNKTNQIELANDLKISTDLEKDPDKVSALKNKVLEKASAGVIHRRQSPLKSQPDPKKVQSKLQSDSNKSLLNVKAESIKSSTSSPYIITSNVEVTNKAKIEKSHDVTNTKSPTLQTTVNYSNEDEVKGKPPSSSKIKQTKIILSRLKL